MTDPLSSNRMVFVNGAYKVYYTATMTDPLSSDERDHMSGINKTNHIVVTIDLQSFTTGAYADGHDTVILSDDIVDQRSSVGFAWSWTIAGTDDLISTRLLYPRKTELT